MSEKKKRNSKARKPFKPSAVAVWIALEIIIAAAVAVAALIRNVYGESIDQKREYTIPTEETTSLGIEDIELPTDLIADSDSAGDVAVGDIYDMAYSDEVLAKLPDMDTKQKVCALLMTSPESLCNKTNVTIAGDVFKEAYTNNPVAGLYFTDSNFTSEADGMKMLATVRGWSRDISGMNILIGYNGEIHDPLGQSDIGINLYATHPDDANAAELSESASENKMIPAWFISPDEVTEGEDGLRIVATDDVESIIQAINDGRKYIYLTGDIYGVSDALISSFDEGTLTPEALDSAAGYALSVRETLTQLRPEDEERTPPEEETPPKEENKTEGKKKTEQKKMTPEEEAAAALAALQKQAEEAMKAATKQAEEAAKAAAAQQE